MIEEHPSTILIVDDEPAVRLLLRDLLSSYHCIAAASGSQAIEILKTSQPDLVICDINMPGMSGFELIDQVLEMSPDTVVVLISGQKDVDDAIRAIRGGAFDFIRKPFE